MGADAGLKKRYHVAIGSPNGAPLAGLMYANGWPLVASATAAYASSPDWARIAGMYRTRRTSNTTARAAISTATASPAPAPINATPNTAASRGLAMEYRN